MYSASKDGHIKRWDLDSTAEVCNRYNTHSNQWCCDFTWLNKGGVEKQLVASVGRDKAIRVWNKGKLDMVDEVKKAHDSSINAVVSNDEFLFTAGDDCGIKMWKCTF